MMKSLSMLLTVARVLFLQFAFSKTATCSVIRTTSLACNSSHYFKYMPRHGTTNPSKQSIQEWQYHDQRAEPHRSILNGKAQLL